MNGNARILTEDDWLKMLYELGARLHRREYNSETEKTKKDWHFTHWLTKYGNAFFAFFRAQREANPEQLSLWWKYHHPSDPKIRVEQADATHAWDMITCAWDAYPKNVALEAA